MTSEDYQLCVRLLKNKIFLGHYAGRHRVDEIDDFRDVIYLHCTEEELQKDIDTLLVALNKSGTPVYIALSDTTRTGAYTLWVQLDGIAFGHYWFQIKHVRLTSKELFCVVSVIRSVPDQLVNPTFSFSQGFECAMRALRGATPGRSKAAQNISTAENNESCSARQYTDTDRREEHQHSRSPRNNTQNTHKGDENRNAPVNNPSADFPIFPSLKDFRGMTFDQIKERFSNDQIGGLIKTLLLCFFFVIIGAMSLLYECLLIFTNLVVVTGDFTIKALHAMSRLIESVAPIFLGVLNFVGKLVTGLYILIAMLCGRTPYMPQQREWAGSPPKREALMYR